MADIPSEGVQTGATTDPAVGTVTLRTDQDALAAETQTASAPAAASVPPTTLSRAQSSANGLAEHGEPNTGQGGDASLASARRVPSAYPDGAADDAGGGSVGGSAPLGLKQAPQSQAPTQALGALQQTPVSARSGDGNGNQELPLNSTITLRANAQDADGNNPLDWTSSSDRDRRPPSTDEDRDSAARALHALAEASAASERHIGPPSRAGSVPLSTPTWVPPPRGTGIPEFAFTPLRSSLAYVPVGGPMDAALLSGAPPNTSAWPYRNPAAPPAGDAFPAYDTPGLAPPPPPEGYLYGAPGGPQGPAFPPPMPGMPMGPYPGDHKLAGEQFASHIQDPSMQTMPSAPETKHRRSASRASQARNTTTDMEDDGESSPASSKRAAKDGTRKSVPRPKSGCYTCRIRRKKCDEQIDEQGSCATCSRLRLECLGFGRKRPDWLRDAAALNATRERIREFLASQGLIKGQFGPAGPHAALQAARPPAERPPLLLLIPDHLRTGPAPMDVDPHPNAHGSPSLAGPANIAETRVDGRGHVHTGGHNPYPAGGSADSFFGPPPGVAGAYYPPAPPPASAPSAGGPSGSPGQSQFYSPPIGHEGGIGPGVLPPHPNDAAGGLAGMQAPPPPPPQPGQAVGQYPTFPAMSSSNAFAREAAAASASTAIATTAGVKGPAKGESDTERTDLDPDGTEDEDGETASIAGRKRRATAAGEDGDEVMGSAVPVNGEGQGVTAAAASATTSGRGRGGRRGGKKAAGDAGRRVRQKTAA